MDGDDWHRRLGRTRRHIWRATLLIIVCSLFRRARHPADTEVEAPTTRLGSEIGEETVAYIGEIAAASFNRQLELDESIWRSLSFLAALFAFIAAVIGRSASDLPRWDGSLLAIVASGLLLCSSLSMAWVLRWFFTVLSPRRFAYPAPAAELGEYARALEAAYAGDDLSNEARDKRVTGDLRLLLIDQHGAGASVNLAHNAERLKARSKVLLFMLIGFVLAFACEATIFIQRRLFDAVEARRDNNAKRSRLDRPYASSNGRLGLASPAEATVRDRGRPILGRQLESTDKSEMTTKILPVVPRPVTTP